MNRDTSILGLSHQEVASRAEDRLEGTIRAISQALLADQEESGNIAHDWAPASMQLLIIDDEPLNIRVLQRYLQELSYTNVRGLTDSTQALDSIREHRPDVVLLDLHMPKVTGDEILAELRCDAAFQYLPVIVITAAIDRQTRLKILELGATDFLHKPIDSSELALRVRNAGMVKRYHDGIRGYAERLESGLRLRAAELEASRREIICCLARAGEFRDNDTGNHVLRVGRYAGLVASAMRQGPRFVEMIELAAQLHDIGKIGIPDEILRRPGALSPDEIETMRQHVIYGQKIINPYERAHKEASETSEPSFERQLANPGRSELIQMASRIAMTHHEKWDGTGYPMGLSGEQIPLEGRITAVADVFDALSSRRPYKPPIPFERCLEIIASESGKHFDPRVAEAFLSQREAVRAIQTQYSDGD
ncbi:MAG: response regulator [Pirellulales bacterium]|nr:response regulator [Pirellulales bacterium]